MWFPQGSCETDIWLQITKSYVEWFAYILQLEGSTEQDGVSLDTWQQLHAYPLDVASISIVLRMCQAYLDLISIEWGNWEIKVKWPAQGHIGKK